ncbi:hypothetical protein DSO57_1023592 [Entomophthora muscae]|uniref:Uncharacterized protein n=1 Tax=Entomophthora muscae TaxID=34485 RepID=A0ACC2U1K8_9FUNG|nr:hypothetical protein DSO57_1023592 [Entomophthora muscae]
MDDPSLTNPCHIVRSRQIQCQIISPVSLTAMILSRYRIHGISFDYARTLLVKLRDEALGLGYNIDWQAGEDSAAILSYCLEAIGPNHVTVEMGNDDGDFSGPTPCPGATHHAQEGRVNRYAHPSPGWPGTAHVSF